MDSLARVRGGAERKNGVVVGVGGCGEYSGNETPIIQRVASRRTCAHGTLRSPIGVSTLKLKVVLKLTFTRLRRAEHTHIMSDRKCSAQGDYE